MPVSAPALKGLPEIRTKAPDTQFIATTKEARAALKRVGPSDERFKRILNSVKEESRPTSQEARWMAGYILTMSGYKLEE